MEYTHDDCEKFITILIDKFGFKMENVTLWLDTRPFLRFNGS